MLKKDEAISRVTPYVRGGMLWFLGQLGGLGWLFIHFLLTVFLAAVLYAKGEQAALGVTLFARRLAGDRGERAVRIATQAIGAVASGIVLTALLQALMAGLGLLLAGVPYAVILACLVFLFGVIQLGPLPILIGATIWLFHIGATVTAWCFIFWSLTILLTDNIVRPFLIKRGANLPLLLIFSGVLGGLFAFGIIGVFIGPVVLAVSYTLLQAWVEEADEHASAQPVMP
jgi:predicted PurR-regulated permease PerM